MIARTPPLRPIVGKVFPWPEDPVVWMWIIAFVLGIIAGIIREFRGDL